MELLAIRLGEQTTLTKSLVTVREGLPAAVPANGWLTPVTCHSRTPEERARETPILELSQNDTERAAFDTVRDSLIALRSLAGLA